MPRRSDKTAAVAIPRPGFQTAVVPQEALGWPTIPGVTYSGLITARYYLDFGPMFEKKGVLSNFPPTLVDRPTYVQFVAKVDKDGNEVAGIRLPAVAAPIGTTTGVPIARVVRPWAATQFAAVATPWRPLSRKASTRRTSSRSQHSPRHACAGHEGWGLLGEPKIGSERRHKRGGRS